MKLKKTYQQIIQLFSANIIKAAIGFIGSIIVLRGWSAADISDIYALIGLMLIFQQIGDLGTGSSFVRLMNQPGDSGPEHQKAITQSYLSFKYIVCSVLFFLGLIFLCYSFYSPKPKETFALAAVFFATILSIFGGFQYTLINAQQRYRELSILKIYPPLIKTLLVSVLLFLGFNHFYWLLLAFLLPSLVIFIQGHYYTQYSVFQFQWKSLFDSSGLKLFHLSKWVFLLGFFQTLFSQIDILMLKSMSSDHQVAQFVSASKVAGVMMLFSQALFTVILPKIKNLNTNEDLKKLSFQFLGLYFVLLVLLIPCLFISPYLVPLILGDRYLDSIPILNVVLFQVLGGMLITTHSLIFFQKNKIPVLVLIFAIQFLLNFIGNYLFIPQYQAMGAVWVSTVLNNAFYIFIFLYTLIFLVSPTEKKQI